MPGPPNPWNKSCTGSYCDLTHDIDSSIDNSNSNSNNDSNTTTTTTTTNNDDSNINTSSTNSARATQPLEQILPKKVL